MRLALCVLIFVCTAQAQSIQLAGFAWPVWRPDPFSVPKLWPPEDSTTVEFLSENQLFVTFPVANKKPGLSERKNPNGGLYLVNAATIDLSSGSQRIETLGNMSAFRRVHRVWGGLLFRRDLDQVYFRDVKGIDHSLSRNARQATPSPLGQLIAFDERTENDRSSVISFYSLLNLEKAGELEVVPAFTMFDYLGDRIAFHFFINQRESVIRIKEPDGAHEFKRPFGCDTPRFLDAKRLIFGCGELVTTDLNGNVLKRKSLGTYQLAMPSTRSIGGLVAGVVMEWSGTGIFDLRDPFSPNRQWIKVWQSDTLAELLSIEVPTRGPAAFGLSPSGDRLAYIDPKGTIHLVNVPRPSVR